MASNDITPIILHIRQQQQHESWSFEQQVGEEVVERGCGYGPGEGSWQDCEKPTAFASR